MSAVVSLGKAIVGGAQKILQGGRLIGQIAEATGVSKAVSPVCDASLTALVMPTHHASQQVVRVTAQVQNSGKQGLSNGRYDPATKTVIG